MKLSKKSKISIIALLLVLVITAGMILTTYLLDNQPKKEWNYYKDETAITYYDTGNEYGFQCASAFTSALKNYLKGNVTSYISYDINIDLFCTKLLQAMSDARIPAVRLEVIAKVISTNDFVTLLDKLLQSINQYDSIEDWSYSLTKNIADESIFTTIASFVSSFLKITTFTVDELAGIVYCYIARYGSNQYQAYLSLYGKENFTKVLSDTLYVLDTLNGIKNADGLSITTEALRSSLYQLGSVYLAIEEIQGSYDTFEKVLGFPDTFPSELTEEYAEDINTIYGNIKGTLGKLLLMFGTFLTKLTSEQISSYLSYYTCKENSSDEMVELEIKLASNQATQDDLVRLNEIIYQNTVRRIYSLELLVTAVNDTINECGQKFFKDEDIITRYTDTIKLMRLLEFYLGDFSNSQTLLDNMNLADEDGTKLKEGLEFFTNHFYTLEEIFSLDVTGEEYKTLVEQTENLGKIGDLLSLYATSAFSVWYTYKTKIWSAQ